MSVKISVIMPCYNVADTVERAIDSILMQDVDFDYEIIAVDDCSKDNTVEILNKYAEKYSFIHLINHQQNKGNAISFYDGLCAAQGDYFCVLDGDDYYTLPDKFKKQVRFLDADVKQEYVGCCHYFVIDLNGEKVSVPDCVSFDEFNYTDFMTQHAGYFHTATHMYRNIFRGNVPEYYCQTIYRGDTPRTTFHLMFSGGKIKILNFVASAYVYTYEGIWSSLGQKKQFEYQVKYLTHLNTTVTSPFEHMAVDILRVRNENQLKTAQTDQRRYPEKTIDQALRRAYRYAQVYAFREKDYFLKGVYNSEYIDTLCATLGVIYRLYHPEHVQKAVKEKHLAIMIWQLNPKGGGLFREVSELIEMYEDWKVSVIVTDGDSNIEKAEEIWKKYENVEVCKVPHNCEDTLAFLSEHLCTFQPEKMYVYCSHTDVFGAAAIQPGICKNICLYSYDHGYLTGLKNPFIDKIVAKRPVDYTLLTHNFDEEKILYIPTWNSAKTVSGMVYAPFRNHDKLVTISCAARFYKVEGGWPYRYEDIIIALMKKTGGRHYHVGEIPDERLASFYVHLDEAEIPRENFVYVPWINDLSTFVLENDIDVFVEPFPTVSYKITLDMLAAGVPVIAFDAVRRMEVTDFLYEGAMRWRSEEEFVNILSNATADFLLKHSQKARHYFAMNHSMDTVRPYIMEDKSMCVPNKWYISDPNILDIIDQKRLFLDCCYIQIMGDKSISGVPNRPGVEILSKEAKAQYKSNLAVQKQLELQRYTNALYNESDEIRRSRSYRLGYIVLYIPRIVKLMLSTAKKQGLKAAVEEARKPDALELHFENAEVEAEYYRHCTCLRVGRILLLPYRMVKKVYRLLDNWSNAPAVSKGDIQQSMHTIEVKIQELKRAEYANKVRLEQLVATSSNSQENASE